MKLLLITFRRSTSKNIVHFGESFQFAKQMVLFIFAFDGTLFVGNWVKKGNVTAGMILHCLY